MSSAATPVNMSWGILTRRGIRALGLVAERYASLGAQNVERRILDLTDYFYQRAKESGIELLYEFPRKKPLRPYLAETRR